MSLLKKIIFGLFVASALTLGLWGYFQVKNSKKPGVEALSLLPDSCLLYLRSGDFFVLNKKVNAQSLIADRLKLVSHVSLLCNTLRAFDSLFNSNLLLQEQIRSNPLHFALYPRLEWLAAFNIKQLGKQEEVGGEMRRLFQAHETEKGIFEFGWGGTTFYFNLGSGVALMSNSLQKIHAARAGASHKLQANPVFKDFEQTFEENALLSVYIDHEAYLKSEARDQLNLCAAGDSGFSAGAVEIQPSEVKVNGYFVPAGKDLISALMDQQPQSNAFAKYLPAHTAAFRAYGISSFQGLRMKLDQSAGVRHAAFWKAVNDTALYNLEEEFYLNINGYVLDFETAFPRQQYMAVQVEDTVIAIDHLRAISDSILKEGPDSLYRLRRAEGGLQLFYPLSGQLTGYAARKGQCLYFSETREGLVQLLQMLNSRQLLSDNESFARYMRQNFYESFNYLVYCAPNQAPEQVKLFFNFNVAGTKDPYENFRHFSFSLARQGERFRFRWQLMHEAEKANTDEPVLWSLKLDTLCSMRASSFVNHITKENELLIQDENNMLYLVNAKGNLLWKKQLNEKIRSEIFIVDGFKNKKYQMAFNSRNYLHLIDRNGNYLPGYPVKLPAEATSDLSIFDYDRTQDYRLLIACKNRIIYNYELSGARQTGFVPYQTEHEVVLPVQYVKVGLSDYLVAVDQEGKIYTFSRRGDGRIGLKNKTVANCEDFYIDGSGNINTTYLVYVDDKNNSINKISFADKKEMVKLDQNINGADVVFGQADAAKTMDIVFTRPNAILVYDINGSLLLNKLLDKDLGETGFYSDERGTLFFAMSAIRQELTIAQPPSQKTLSFRASALPLASRLFNDHKKYMVLPYRSRLNCVLLN